MKHTRETWIARWKHRLIGLGICGYVSDTRESPMERARKVFDMPREIEGLLGLMYDDLDEKAKPPEKPK